MTDTITLRYNGIEERLECHNVRIEDGVVTLEGLPQPDERSVYRVDSKIFQTAPGGIRGEYHGVSMSMADPRGNEREKFPKNYFYTDEDALPNDVRYSVSEIGVVDVEYDVNE